MAGGGEYITEGQTAETKAEHQGQKVYLFPIEKPLDNFGFKFESDRLGKPASPHLRCDNSISFEGGIEYKFRNRPLSMKFLNLDKVKGSLLRNSFE